MLKFTTGKFIEWFLKVLLLCFAIMLGARGLSIDYPGITIVNIMISIVVSLIATIIIFESNIPHG
jgi:hypothetical protein